jgi:hypothetical protein
MMMMRLHCTGIAASRGRPIPAGPHKLATHTLGARRFLLPHPPAPCSRFSWSLEKCVVEGTEPCIRYKERLCYWLLYDWILLTALLWIMRRKRLRYGSVNLSGQYCPRCIYYLSDGDVARDTPLLRIPHAGNRSGMKKFPLGAWGGHSRRFF